MKKSPFQKMLKEHKAKIIVGVIIILLVFGYTRGWFNNFSKPSNVLGNTQTGASVGIHTNLTTVCANTNFVLYIDSNMPGAQCSLYISKGTTDSYKSFYATVLDSKGSYDGQTVVSYLGTIELKATCVKDDKQSNSNELTLLSKSCTQQEQQQIQQQQQQVTCAQLAQQNGAYFTETVSTGAQCQNYANIDCQQKGKSLDGYAITGTCCYYLCVAVNQPQQPVCTDSDGGQDDQHLMVGTVTDPDGSYTDYCWGDGRLAELYCENGDGKLMLWECGEGMTCRLGKCDLTMCEDIMNANSQADCEGHPTTDGGTCAYWAGMGCLSSFG